MGASLSTPQYGSPTSALPDLAALLPSRRTRDGGHESPKDRRIIRHRRSSSQTHHLRVERHVSGSASDEYRAGHRPDGLDITGFQHARYA